LSCRQVRRLLPLHVGGDLDPSEASTVDRHLDACAECAAEGRVFQAARSALLGVRTSRARPAGAGLWSAIEARLDATDAAALLRRPWYRKASVWSAAAAAALLLALIPVLRPDPGSDSVAPGDSGVKDGGTVAGLEPSSLRMVPDEVLEEFLRRGAWVRPTNEFEDPILGTAAAFRFAEY